MDGPSAQRFLSLTAFQAEGCGIARRAMSFISRLRRSRQHRVSILSAYLVHPFPLRGTSPQGETRVLRDWLSVSYSMISTLVIGRITTVHPFATSWPSSPKGDARSVTGLAFCITWHDKHSVIGSLRSPPPFPLRGTAPYAGGRIKHRETLSS